MVTLTPKTYSAPDENSAVGESIKCVRPDLSPSSPEYREMFQRLVARRRESGAWIWDFVHGLRQPWNPVEELLRLKFTGLTDSATVKSRIELESVELVTLDLLAFYCGLERARIDGFAAVIRIALAWNNQPIDAKVDTAARTARDISGGLSAIERKSGLWSEEILAVQNAVQEFRAEAKLGRVTVAGHDAGSAFELVLTTLRDVVETWAAVNQSNGKGNPYEIAKAIDLFLDIVSKGPLPRNLESQLDSDFALAKVTLKGRAVGSESPEDEQPSRMTWQELKPRIESRVRGGRYPGRNALAREFDCHVSVIDNVLKNSEIVRQEWQRFNETKKAIPKRRQRQWTGALTDSVEAPADVSEAASEDVEDRFRQLIEAACPEDRAKLNAMSAAKRLELITEIENDPERASGRARVKSRKSR